MPKYSVVIPVYDRPRELDELLDSLSKQTRKDFEVLVVEDGSNIKSDKIAEKYVEDLEIRYLYKKNTGPGDTRNYGMRHASADFILIFDSDCLIPPDYFEKLENYRDRIDFDAFGGPDKAHSSFSPFQKAISHTLTSYFTTGGIRGRANALEKFNPRSFNMGMKKEVFNKTGGFPDVLLAEDTDLAIRMHQMGLKVVLLPECYVYHKRRVDAVRFFRQMRNFGYGRAILSKNHPGSFKLFFLFPTIFLGYLILAIPHAIFHRSLFVLWPSIVYLVLVFTEALIKSKDLKMAALTIPSVIFQLCGYGWGLLKGVFEIFILKKSTYLQRDENPLKKAM